MSFRSIGRTFGTGLVVILPLAVTIYVLYWLVSSLESLVESILEPIPQVEYVAGQGVVITVALIFAFGLAMKVSIARRVLGWMEGQVNRVPLVKTLYGSFRDLMDFFSGSKEQEMSKVVMVDLDGSGRQRLMGFVMREQFDDLPEGVGDESRVAVYLPMSYQIGGFTTIVPRDAIQPIDMSIQDGMRFALTAGVKKEKTE
jgi:uncharacterized membrane protein